MSDGRAERLAELVKSALEQDPPDWSAFLDDKCSGDAAMRAEAESLLKHHRPADGFIERPALHIAADSLVHDGAFGVGQIIGDYEICSLIGAGGMGEVYLAQDRQLNRKVALKFVRRAMASGEILRRFKHEAHLLASLNHPNIAQLHGSGLTADGIPFFAMELIEGERLDEYCSRRQLPIRERLQLFRKVCAAVDYAHQHLVIHRDLKPANIRVTSGGEPKLLDFGIAKLLDPENGAGDALTIPGMMTLDYASPEQVRGEGMTTASDVYSLGVILYELLTGQKPYKIVHRNSESLARAITGQEPVRPSTTLETPTTSDATTSRSVKNSVSAIRGDLDNIVLKALRKEPPRRYSSVGQFSEDVRRHLEGRPVIARKDTWTYRTTKFVLRNKLGVAAAALVLLVLVGAVIATSREAKIATAQRDRAQIEKANAERVSTFLQNVLLLADPSWIGGASSRGRELTTDRLLETASVRARKELADQPAVLGGVLRSIGNTYRAQGDYDKAEQNLRDGRELLSRTYGSQNYDTVNVTYNLAQCLMQAGKYPAAEELLRPAVQYFRDHVDRNNDGQVTALAGALNDFAVLLRYQGRPKESEALVQEAMQFAPRWQGTVRAIVGVHLINLGMARDDQGDLPGAEKYLREAVAEFRRLPGGDRLELGIALFSLGHILTTERDFANAEPAIRDGLGVYHRLVGDEHPALGIGLDRLGRLQLTQGDLAGAQRSCEQAIAIQTSKLPVNHSARAYPLTTLGIVLTRSGKPAEAEPQLRRALSLRQNVLPPAHWLVAETKQALGECLTFQKNYAEAESLLLESRQTLEASLGPSHPRTKEAARSLVALYQDWMKPQEAERFRSP